MSKSLLAGALALYGLGIVLSFPAVIRRRPALSTSSLAALGLGLLLHAVALATETAQIRRLPVIDVASALSFFAFLLTTAFFFVYLRYRIASLGLFMLPLVFVLSLVSLLNPAPGIESPPFRGAWLVVHIGSTFLGYTGFFLTFVAALMYLFQERELKSKKPRAFYYRLPSLDVCDELYYRSLLFGLPFLSVGILTGFVGARQAWQGPWGLDPKIVASLLTWVVYLLLFATRASGSWRGRRAAYGAIFGFVTMMATFLGVSFLSGQHGFSPNFGGTP